MINIAGGIIIAVAIITVLSFASRTIIAMVKKDPVKVGLALLGALILILVFPIIGKLLVIAFLGVTVYFGVQRVLQIMNDYQNKK